MVHKFNANESKSHIGTMIQSHVPAQQIGSLNSFYLAPKYYFLSVV